jgi:hypothetical protein
MILATAAVSGQEIEKQDLQSTPPAVFLNHVYIVLDSDTFNAVNDSELITKEFSGYEKRTTTTADGDTWSGSYLYGMETYIEFFDIATEDWARVGYSGLALGVEEADAISWVGEQLSKVLTDCSVRYSLRRLDKDGSEVPWFYYTWLECGEEENVKALYLWIMEYHEDFLSTMMPEMYPESGDITRKSYLQRFSDPERHVRNISGIRVLLPTEESAVLVAELRAVGWSITQQSESTICKGPDFEVIVDHADEGTMGIKEIHFILSRIKEGETTFTLGNSVLEFGGDLTAVWTFDL